MKFTITYEAYEPKKEYLLLTFIGEIRLDILPEYAPNIVTEIRNHNCLKLVEDYRKATLAMDTKELISSQDFEVDHLTSKGIPFINVKRAMVVDESLISHDDMAFFETLSVNRGQKVKVFTDMIKAIQWINMD